jgi:hypothetical protein
MLPKRRRAIFEIEKPWVMSRISITSEIDPVYIISVGELVEMVTDMSANGQFVWYRGHASQGWDVLPSIWRGYSSEML